MTAPANTEPSPPAAVDVEFSARVWFDAPLAPPGGDQRLLDARALVVCVSEDRVSAEVYSEGTARATLGVNVWALALTADSRHNEDQLWISWEAQPEWLRDMVKDYARYLQAADREAVLHP